MRTSRIVKSMFSLDANSYGFYRKAEDVEVRFYGMVNAHTVNSLVSGHPRELKNVSVSRAVRLRELFP